MTSDQQDTFSNQDLIDVLGFTPSTFRCLRNGAIFTIQDLLVAQNRGELRLINGLDILKLNEITEVINRIKININSNDSAVPQSSVVPTAPQKSEFRPAYYDDLIEELGLCRRSYNSLKRVGVNKIGSIMSLIETDALLSVRNLGEKGEIEIKEAIKNYSEQYGLGVAELQETSLPEGLLQIYKHPSVNVDQKKSVSTDEDAAFSSLNENLKFVKTLSLNFLRGELGDKLVEKLLSINVFRVSDLTKISESLSRFLSSYSPVLDKAVRSAKHILRERIKKGTIHPGVNLDGVNVDHFLTRPLLSDDEKKDFLSIVNKVVDYLSLDQEIAMLIKGIPLRNLRVFLSYTLEDTTYEEISDFMEITRERVRQIYSSAIDLINRSLILNPIINIQSSCLYANDLGGKLSISSWRSILIEKKIFENMIKFDGYSSFDVMRAILINKNIQPPNLPGSPGLFEVLTSGSELSLEEINVLSSVPNTKKREIRKVAKFTGGIHILNAAQILDFNQYDSRILLSSLGLSEIVSDWFSFSKANLPKGCPLVTGGLGLIEACGPLSFEVFCDGLRRYISRHYPSLAPKKVLKHILPILGFIINNDVVSWPEKVQGYLSDSELLFLKLISEKGPVVSFPEILDYYVENGFSSATASSRIMGQSAIVERINTGYYTLRGSNYSPQDLEDTRSRQDVYLKDPVVTYGLDGNTRYQITIGSWSLGGTLSVCRSCLPIPDLSGGWDVHIENSHEIFGKIIRDDNLIWGLGPAFNVLKIKIGDRVELVFDTWSTPKVTVRVIDAR